MSPLYCFGKYCMFRYIGLYLEKWHWWKQPSRWWVFRFWLWQYMYGCMRKYFIPAYTYLVKYERVLFLTVIYLFLVKTKKGKKVCNVSLKKHFGLCRDFIHFKVTTLDSGHDLAKKAVNEVRRWKMRGKWINQKTTTLCLNYKQSFRQLRDPNTHLWPMKLLF